MTDSVVASRILELAERIDASFPWHGVQLDHDTLTDVRELVNWILYRDNREREGVVAVLAGNERKGNDYE